MPSAASPADTFRTLSVHLLGVPRLLVADGPGHVLERRDAALFALLALNGPTPRSRIATLLWPDTPVAAAHNALRQRLFRLKRRIGVELVVSSPLMALATGLRHDLQSTADGQNDGAPPTDHEVLLGAHDYDDLAELNAWVMDARVRWTASQSERLARRSSQLEAEGGLAQALSLAERLALQAPTAEHAHRRVMRLHYRRGDRAAALAAYEICREALARELDTTPGIETRELAALIERSELLTVPARAPSPVATLRPPRLVGREREWQTIEAAWQRNQVVLLLGEPGIGKSRLATDFAATHVLANVQRAHSGDARVPYSLLARLLRGLFERFGEVPLEWARVEFAHLLPELGPQPGGKVEPLRLRQAVVAAMAHWRETGLVTLVLDDLQFADEASLELLLAWSTETVRPQIVMTARSNELPPLLVDWLRGQRAGGGGCEVALTPLDAESIASLLDSLGIPGLDSAAWAGPLARRTGGNPLFILETLKAEWAHGVGGNGNPAPLASPATTTGVGRLLDLRLQQLSGDALRLARVAALAGPDFTVALASRVLSVHVLDLSEPWAELERSQIIHDGAFAHDLILEATLRSVPDAIAREMHMAIALALEANAQAPARTAQHWQLAHEWRRAAPHFERAAGEAQAMSRAAESLALWDVAATCHERAGSHRSAFAARHRAIGPAILVEPPDKVRARVDSLLAASSEATERLDALIARGLCLGTTHAFVEMSPVTAEAMALAQRLGDRHRELMAVNLHGAALTMTGQAAAGLALFESTAAGVAVTDDDSATGEFCSAYGYALHATGQIRRSVSWIERAAAIAQRLGESSLLAINLGNLSGILARLGRDNEALDVSMRAQAAQARLGEVRGEPYAISLANIGLLQLRAGRFTEALAAFDEVMQCVGDAPSSNLTSVSEHHRADTYLTLGQPARARQSLSSLNANAPPTVRARRAVIEWRIAAFAARPGAQRLLEALHELGSSGSAMHRLGLELAIGAALPPDEGLPWCERVLAEGSAADLPTVVLAARLRMADAHRRLGQATNAAAAARIALGERAGAVAYDMPAPEFWWLAFQAFEAAGCEAEALDALRVGNEWIMQAVNHTPPLFRESFMHRNPCVVRLHAIARQRLVP